MKLIVLSDSHGLKQPLAYIRSTYEDADCIIHCGDICLPKEYAKGIIVLENHRILILHGHVLFSSSFVNKDAIVRCAKRNDCDIVFFGHSHVYCDEIIDGIHLYNPGSITQSRDGSQPSYMIVTLDTNSCEAKRMTYQPYQ